jgi:type IV secretion system protein VirB1
MIPAALLACALNVAPVTLEAVIGVESGGNPLALNVNGLSGPQPHASTPEEAATLARQYIAAGHSVDIGLMQINSRNLPALGATVEQVLDPCTNIRSGATILTANYVQASQRFAPGQPALQAALSAYNTGSFYGGFENGYVAKYYGRATIPSIAGIASPVAATPAVWRAPSAPASAINPYTADINVYQREATNVPIQ